MAGVVTRLRSTYEVLAREAAKFGVVGGVAFVVNFGVFNLLRFGGPDGIGILHHKPLTSNVIAVVISILVAWLGNRYWTFRHRRRASAGRELVLFVVMNAAGLAISMACLGFTYYVLDLRGPVASNVSANGVGLVLGTLFRWWAYRKFVFVTELAQEGWRDGEPPAPSETVESAETAQPPTPPTGAVSGSSEVHDVRGGQVHRG